MPIKSFLTFCLGTVSFLLLYVSSVHAQDVSKVEYFMNADPGFGNGINVPVTPGNDITSSFQVNMNSLPSGFHNLYVRALVTPYQANENGISVFKGGWSITHTRSFYKETFNAASSDMANVVKGEYYIDNDPGFGNGSFIQISPGTDLSNVSFTIDITAHSNGFHHLYVRFQNSNGTWGMTNSRSYYKQSGSQNNYLPNISRVEYFIDNDPGFGNGKEVNITPATDINNVTFPIDMTNISVGNHQLYVRAIDSTGNWSLTNKGSFKADSSSALILTVGSIIGNLCVGNAISLPFTVSAPFGTDNVFTAQLSNSNGSFESPVEIGSRSGNVTDSIQAIIPANITLGNGYRIRIVSSSPVNTSAANNLPLTINKVPEQDFIITGKPDVCIGTENYSASSIEPGANYNWSLSGGGTIEATGSTAKVNWTTGGIYTLKLIASNACGNGPEKILPIIVFSGRPTISPTITESNRTLLSSSATVAEGVSGRQWYKNGIAIAAAVDSTFYAAEDGSYTVSYTNPCGTGPQSNAVTIGNKQTQTLNFQTVSDKAYGDGAFVLQATSSSSLPVTFAIVSGPGTIKSDTLIIKGAGIITVRAIQAGNELYNSATADITFTVKKASAFITFSNLIQVYSGAPKAPAVSTNPTGLPVSLTFDGRTTVPVNPGSYKVIANVNSVNYSGSDSATFVIQPNELKAPDLAIQSITSSQADVASNDVITVSWNVANIGTAQSFINWTERIYMQSATGQNRTLLKQTVFVNTDVLDTIHTLARSEVVNIPGQLNIGDQGVFVVELIPGPTIKESPGSITNNTGIQQIPWSVRKQLTMELSITQITEGSYERITAIVKRTGSLLNPLTVNINLNYPERFSFPASITIPVGQAGLSFTLSATDNNTMEGTITDTLRISAESFQEARASLAILDNDKPSLSITGLPAGIMEGRIITFRVITNFAPTAPLQVFLTSGNLKRFPVPSSVFIPVGNMFVDVPVELEQDNIPELDLGISITVAATDHNPAKATILVNDDDLPGLELIVQTKIISESAGLFATQATLRRTSKSNSIAFTANLSANLPNSLILPGSISLAANENEKSFNVGVVDNSLVDGQRQVSITASIFLSSCGCSAPPASSGSVSEDLTISDNDGPALQLTATQLTLPEGSANAGSLRVIRNTAANETLLVNLSSSDTSEATLPATVLIPIGQVFVDVPITTIHDGETDGSQRVYFQATTGGFSPGSVWVLVTDLNKPDLQIPVVILGNVNIQAMTVFNYQFSVKNTGFATAPLGALVRGYLSLDNVIDDSDTLISEDVVTRPIGAGQTVQLLNAGRAPNLPGKYNLLFWVNPDVTFAELLVTNNISAPVNLTIKPDYTATATVNLPYFVKGTTIPITGSAMRSTGTPAANEQVEVYVITSGLRRKFQATTDSAGNYTSQFIPLANEAGHYTVGASFPGTGETTQQDAFDIIGVRINGGKIAQFPVVLNDTLRSSLTVQNLSSKSLTTFSVVPVSLPGGAYIRFDTLPVFAGNTTINLAYTVTGSALSPGNNFEVAGLQAISDEGTIQKVDVFYFCQAPNAYIVADVSKIDIIASQSKGERLVELKLVNQGLGSTGDVTIRLPEVNWISSITAKVLPAMATGDTAMVVLKFLSLPEVPFNFPIKGSIGIVTQNGNSLNIPFTFEKVAETAGGVKINVVNQFTYFSEGAPKVKGALVTVKNYFSGVVYAQGYTDSTGILTVAAIPEGRHRITVEKDKHLPYDNTITIDPGDTVETTVFINYQAITFSWSVVPTAIQDQYDITLVAQFETHVPVPVVIIEMPKTMPQLSGSEEYAFNVTLTNHGLITAKDVALNFPANDPEYEFITNYQPADLLAQQSIQVPVIMRRRIGLPAPGTFRSPTIGAISEFLGMEASQFSTLSDEDLPCQDFVNLIHWYYCSFTTGLWVKGGVLFTFEGRRCSTLPASNDPILIGGSRLGGGDGFPQCAICPHPSLWEGKKGWTFPFVVEKKNCVECILSVISVLAGCPKWPTKEGKLAGKVVGTGATLGSFAYCLRNSGNSTNRWGCTKDVVLNLLMSCIPSLITATLCIYEGFSEPPASARSLNSLINDVPKGIFAEQSEHLQIAFNASQAGQDWAIEFYGAIVLTDSWESLRPLLAPYVTEQVLIDANAQASILSAMAGYETDTAMLQAFFLRYNTSLKAISEGVFSRNAKYPDIIDQRVLDSNAAIIIDAFDYSSSKGFSSVDEMYESALRTINEVVNAEQNAVCATVSVQFSQQLAMTREAFEGTLEIFNGHPTDQMDSLSVNIEITDANGVPSNGLFEIQIKSLTNLADISGTGIIAAQQKGLVKFLFIPELMAAPQVTAVYSFSGSVRYWDPYAQAMVTLPLASVPLTVNPSPNLMLHYFMERNILGDDALTMPEIEPSIPAELAVMVENRGYGSAVNLTISSAQPKIVENEKGLAINFSLVGSNFQGQPKKMGVTDINFGTIPALQARIGQWYFTSSLLGKFVSYEASVVHANSFGNPALSLVSGVNLHELTRSIRSYDELEDGINDFLVNDIFDSEDKPDLIYFSQGNRTAKVFPAAAGSFLSQVLPPSFTNTLTVTASDTGWNYIKLNDPGNRLYELVSITRSDGQVIPLNNAWLSFVTLPVSRTPVYENKFHFADRFASLEAVTYNVVWKPLNLNVPKVVSISGAPKEVTSTQVLNLTVAFDKSIDPSTFTYDDLVLTFQGGPNMIDSFAFITQIDSSNFNVDISGITTGNGFYAFTAQAANVADIYGISGLSGKQVTWSQYVDVPMVQAFQGIPAGNVASSFDTIQVLFNLPIDLASATPEKFTIVKNGVLQSATLTIDSVRADHKLFYLSGLKNILTLEGAYELIVDLPNIQSINHVFGITPQSVILTVDNTGPLVLSLEKSITGGLDSQHITFVNIQFNEDVVGFNIAAVRLTRNGAVLPLDIAQLSNQDLKSWSAGNFGMLTYLDGDYTLTVDLGEVKDATGNSGSGSQQVSWTIKRSASISILNLAITPDLGFSNTDGITSVQSLNVAFNLTASVSKITISQIDLSEEIVLANFTDVAAGDISLPVTLLTGGNTGIRVKATGLNGEVGTAEQTLFIDQIALSAQWLFAANQSLTIQVDTIAILFSTKLLSDTGFLSAIQFRRNEVLIPTDGLRFEVLNDSIYNVYGLRQSNSLPGNYELTFNLKPFSKYRSGKAGMGLVPLLWTVQSTNLAPIAKAGNDIAITAPGLVTLNSSASSDPDSNPITYRWLAPEGVLLSDSFSATPSFTITAADQGNTYSFLLIVSDGSLFTTDVVDVVVNLIAIVYFRDADGDGYGNIAITATGITPPAGYVANSGDCNDNDATVYSGASELCDGKDNNCNGQIDEGFELTTYYKDADGDGYGIYGDKKIACIAPSGYVSAGGDCNDLNPAIRPNAPELCDGLDNDCDGIRDNGAIRKAYYRDADNDGYGVATSKKIEFCTAPPGFVDVSGDCNDNNAAIHPNAKEICDGLDNNCDGTIDNGCNGIVKDKGSKIEFNQKQSDGLSVKIEPNPSKHYFNLITKGGSNIPLQVRILNSTGSLVERWSIAANGTLQIGHNYRPGFYIIEVMQGKQIFRVKLIKQSK